MLELSKKRKGFRFENITAVGYQEAVVYSENSGPYIAKRPDRSRENVENATYFAIRTTMD